MYPKKKQYIGGIITLDSTGVEDIKQKTGDFPFENENSSESMWKKEQQTGRKETIQKP